MRDSRGGIILAELPPPSKMQDTKQRKSTGEEIEVKLRVSDRRALLGQLARQKARLERARVHEMNTLYDTPEGTLARNGQLLRIRVERPAGKAGNGARSPRRATGAGSALLTYKGPQRGGGREGGPVRQRYKVREEREVRIGDPEALASVLEAIGLRGWFRYEKYRTSYRLPGLPRLKVEMDETPIGDFLELEGDRGAIDSAAARLGFGPADFISLSYGALFREWADRAAGDRSEPVPGDGLGDMLFRKRR
jgi:adenylate cyclase, class 2